jgi:subtilisin family serine protease
MKHSDASTSRLSTALPAVAARTTRITLVLILAAALLHVTGVYAGGKAGKPRPDKVIARIDPASGVTIEKINEKYDTETVKPIKFIAGGYVLRTRDGRDARPVADKMEKDRQVLSAEVDLVSAPPEADPSNIGAWGFPDAAPYLNQDATSVLNLPKAHAVSRGADAVVAVLDTGVQLDHPSLAASLLPGYDFVDDDALPEDVANGADDDDDGRIDEAFGHGTHIAGIIHLVAPEAKIIPIRVLDADGNGYAADVAAAIAFAIQNAASVINLSLGTTVESRLVRSLVSEAASRGIVVVAAVGNTNGDDKQYPAADECALAITSVGPSGVRSPFSSFGKWVDFAAPGEAIYSTFPYSQYAHWSGTSMATPFVAGQAALIKSYALAFTVRDVARLIEQTAYTIDDLKLNKKFHDKLGVGRIDIGKSLETLASGSWHSSGPSDIKGHCIN